MWSIIFVMNCFCFFQFWNFVLYFDDAILYRTCFSMKFTFCCASKLSFTSSNLFVDRIFLNESMKFQIEYSIILIRTIESHAFQFLKKFNLNFRFVFVIVLNERINRKKFLIILLIVKKCKHRNVLAMFWFLVLICRSNRMLKILIIK